METKIQELRKANRISQAELTETLVVTRQAVISFERGHYSASLELTHKIARYSGKTIEKIFILKDEKQEKKMNTLYETMKNSSRVTLENIGLATLGLGQLLLLTALVANLSDLLSGFLLTMSIILDVLSITFFQDKILGEQREKILVLKALISLTQRKTLEGYRHYMMIVSLSLLFVAALCLLIPFSIKANNFAAGLLLGGGVAGLVVVTYHLALARQPNRLKAAYIAAYDERNQFILRVAAISALIFLFLENSMLIILYAFMGMVLTYPIILLIWLYSLFLGFVLFKLMFTGVLQEVIS